jgi:predicted metal-binding membrane protein
VSGARAAPASDRGALAAGAVLLAAAIAAWLAVLRGASGMSMHGPGAAPSLGGALVFTGMWGVMMAAMMLPSAAPMILLYRTVSRRFARDGERVIPAWGFAGVYLCVWMLLGVPVYAGYLAVARAAERIPAFGALAPYLVALSLAAAGAYQLTAAKRACLRYCESPLDLLMRRWRSGYGATLRLALRHAGYCVGCCWGLMLVLVAAGSMSLPWVLVIALAVAAEKILPRGWGTARWLGVALIALAAAVALRPGLAGTLRGGAAPASATEGAGMPPMPGMP